MKGHDFQGVNAAYVAELYDRYRQDPNSVDAATRAEFDAGLIPGRRGQPPPPAASSTAPTSPRSSAPSTSPSASAATGTWRRPLDPLGSQPDRRSVARRPIARRHRTRCCGGCRPAWSAARSPRPRPMPSRRSTALRQIYCSTHRLRLLARLRARRARLAAPRRRDRAASGRRSQPIDDVDAARSPHRGRSLRAVPAPRLPRQDALLDRRPRHADPDPRRDHRRRRRRPAARTC